MPDPVKPGTVRPWPPVRVILAVAAAYLVTARLGLLFAMPGGHVTPVWPPSGIALAAMLLCGRRVWPGIWLGSFAANLWDFLHAAPPAPFAISLLTAAAIGGGAALTAWVGAELLRRFVGPDSPLERVRSVGAFMGLGGGVSCLVSATNGVACLALGGFAPWSGFGQAWLTWWLGDTAGIFVITPLVLAWGAAPAGRRRVHPVEAGLCFALLLAASYGVFLANTESLFSGKPFTFVLIPFLVWPALRFGQRGAASASFLIACHSVWGTIHGSGPFHLGSRHESLLVLELFLSVVSLTALCIAAVVTEQRAAESGRQQVLDELESRVAERTAALDQANAALRASEQRLRTIIETEPECVKVLSPEGRLLEMNAAGLAMLDAARLEELNTRPLLDFVAPEHRPAFAALHRQVIAGGSGRLEFETIGLQGTRRWLETHAVPLRDAAGRVTALLGVTRDITGRKQAGTALRASEARYRTLFEYAPDGIVIFLSDPERHLIAANASLCQMLGYTRDELIRLRPADIVTQAEIQHIVPALNAINAGADYHREWQFRRQDGSVFAAEVIATLMPDGNLLAMIRDITERKEHEQQFLRAQRMESIGTLAGGIAHDLNNVLGPIMMALNVLQMRFPDPASLELIDIISSSAQHGADMVRQILSFARGVEGRKMEVQVGHLIREIEKNASDTFLKNIQVRTSAPHELWTVLGDPTQLHQVLLNLCVNARDAMPGGGTLAISAQNLTLDAHYAGLNPDATAGPYVCLQVEDSGTGMPPQVLARIFDPFFTTKEVGKGTGLGLSTSLGIVKSHGGFIRVESEPGEGTTFKICLPALTETAPAAAAEPAAEMPRGHGELILVVDDEAAVRQITRQTLQAFGYRVVLAADGAEAAVVFARQGAEIAVVLTDMTMPVLDGPATIQVLRRMNPAVRIIAMSGLSANGGVALASGLGVNHFLPKPYTAETLLMALRQVLAAEA